MFEAAEGMNRSQAVQITTLLGDSVVSMHRLDGEACGRVRPATRGMLALAVALGVGGLIAAALSSLGAAATLLLLGTGLGVFGATRAGRERRPPHFLVGEGREAHLPMPGSLLPAPCYPLVLSTPSGYHLLFGAGMEGIVEENGVQLSLRDLAGAGTAWPAAGLDARAVPLPARGRAWVRIGESTVVIDSVEPTSLRAPLLGGLDSSGLMSNAFSFSAHAVVLGLVFAIPPSSATLTLDGFNLDSHTVGYKIRPPDIDKDSVQPWLKRKVNEDRPAGGPAARGPAGKMGDPKARPEHGRAAVKGTSAELRPAREWARELAARSGVLDILGRRSAGGPLTTIFGSDDPLGTEARTAMGGLIGDHIGPDYGIGGLGLIGTGRGGGCEGGDCALIPGTGIRIPNGRGPGGWGPFAAPKDRLREHRVRVPVKPGVITVVGPLDKELIRREIKKHLNEVRFCYSKELQGKPELEGRVIINFTIAATGKVVSSKVQLTTLGDSAVESCITQAFYRWTFPKPPDQGMVVVSYPFIFHHTEP